MNKCSLCRRESSFMNALVNKTKDGHKICRKCFKTILSKDRDINIKKHTKAEIVCLLDGKMIEKILPEKVDVNIFNAILQILLGIVSLYLIYKGISVLILLS